jgi:tight adherence protein C
MDNQTAILIICVLLAILTIVGAAMPVMARLNKKKKYMSLIKDRRQGLYQEVVNETKAKPKQIDASAQENVANFFKVEQMVGKTATNIRRRLNQAGYRGANAPIKFMVAKIALPVVFVLLAMMFMSKAEDLSSGVKFLVLFGCAGFGWFLPGIIVKNQIDKRQEEINISFPDALDMILVCVQGGISIEQAIVKIGDEIADQSEALAEELSLLSAELGLLSDRRQAFADFADRVGSGAAKSFGTAMVQAEKYGTSISQALRVMSDELRDMRMAEAERKAASLPPKLTVPMIVFFLPALFIAILAPAFLQATGG